MGQRGARGGAAARVVGLLPVPGRIALLWAGLAGLTWGAPGWTGDARAQLAPDEVPVIEPGREQEIVALFAPFELTGEVQDGYRLMNIRVETTRILCDVVGPGDAAAELSLTHPDLAAEGEMDARSASFAIDLRAPDPAARGALERLAQAVRENDAGGFYRMRARPSPEPGQRFFQRAGGIAPWLVDGTLWCALGLCLLLVLVARQLRREPRPVVGALLGLTLLGALLRIGLSPHTMMGVWPYSRMTTLMRHIWTGPALGGLSDLFGPLYYTDIVTTVTLLFAVVTPIAVWAHARQLLDDRWAALAAAGIVAVLPTHIRFSHSEVAFIPSIALSSITFYLTHVALKDTSTRWSTLALLALPVAAAAMFVARPLNVIFLPLLLATALWLARRTASARRRILASTLLTGVAMAALFLHFLVYYGGQAREGLSLDVLLRGLGALFSFQHNTLINPWITPPLLVAAAVAGGVWRVREGDRDRVTFLVAWLLLFFVTHAYVLPVAVANQARYHLHLVVPFVLLAALGLTGLWRRWPRWGVALAVVTALSPLIHLGFIRDVDYNDMAEYRFALEMRDRIPEGCTVLEHTGFEEGDQDARYGRLGMILGGRAEERRFVVVPMGAARDAGDPLRPEARALLDDPPACLVYYEGLLCWGKKEPSEPIAPPCQAVREAVPLEELGRVELESHVYDGNLGEGLGRGDDHLTLRVYRVRPRGR